jgi:hypothetical protein
MLRKFFCGGTISPPKALIFGKKGEQKRPVNQKNRGILATWRDCTILFALSSTQD